MNEVDVKENAPYFECLREILSSVDISLILFD